MLSRADPRGVRHDTQQEGIRMIKATAVVALIGSTRCHAVSAETTGRQATLRGITNWLPGNSAQPAAKRGTPEVSFVTYDWALNEQNRKVR